MTYKPELENRLNDLRRIIMDLLNEEHHLALKYFNLHQEMELVESKLLMCRRNMSTKEEEIAIIEQEMRDTGVKFYTTET